MWDAIGDRELNEEEGQCTWAARRDAFVMPMRTPFRSDRSCAGQGVLQRVVTELNHPHQCPTYPGRIHLI